MRLDSDERCQLLFAVHPTFVEALPAISESPNSQLMDMNVVTLLRNEIKMITISFNEEVAGYEFSEKSFHDGHERLNDILCLFENLVKDSILQDNDLDHNENAEMSIEFPRLVALKSKLLKRNAGTISNLISFGTNSAAYNLARSTAKSFTQTISRIFSEIGRESSVQINQAVQQDTELDMSLLIQAQRLSEASGDLLRLLKEIVCDEFQNPHMAHIHLSGFDKPEFDMIFSLCRKPDLWHPVSFSQLGLADVKVRGDAIEDICTVLRASYRKTTSRMLFSGRDIRRSPGTQSRIRNSPKPSIMTLRQILRKEDLKRKEIHNYRILKRKDKMRLGLLIATSLLNLYGSPLLQNTWNADTIYIRQKDDITASKDAFSEAYIKLSLNSELIEQHDFDKEAGEGDPYFLALTSVLLELELEKEIIVGEEDKDELSGNPSLYLALTRQYMDLEDCSDDVYGNIIDACLQLYDDSGETQMKDYNRKIRTRLFQAVVCPLKRRYEVFTSTGKFGKQLAARPYDDYSSIGLAPPQALSLPARLRSMETVLELSEGQESETLHPTTASDEPSKILEPLFLASRGSISSSRDWLERIDAINSRLAKIAAKHPTTQRVKVAILDTGCDLDAGCIVGMPGAESRLIGHWHDWVDDSAKPIDEDSSKHGTALVALLLRVALHAEVFVGRVAKDKNGLQHAAQQISDAIHYAVMNWGVDIVTMSFGFPVIKDSIETAIADVIRERRKMKSDILFFAAANNNGLNSKELFPASNETVISVRGTDHTGEFVQKYNPEPWSSKRGTPLFGTLGEKVSYDSGNPNIDLSGCSLATPILAGVMAMIIQYVSHVTAEETSLWAELRTRRGLLQVMHYIADEGLNNRWYVAPWKFFLEKDDEQRLALIRHALADLQRRG